jgi:hypothetical protein
MEVDFSLSPIHCCDRSCVEGTLEMMIKEIPIIRKESVRGGRH